MAQLPNSAISVLNPRVEPGAFGHTGYVEENDHDPRFGWSSVPSTLSFRNVPADVAACRRFVSRVLRGCPDETVNRAVLLTSELVSNAIIHGTSSGELAVDRTEGRLRLAVTDRSQKVPTMMSHGPQDAHGRGLAIVDALADQWGVDLLDSGKIVWATLEDPQLHTV